MSWRRYTVCASFVLAAVCAPEGSTLLAQAPGDPPPVRIQRPSAEPSPPPAATLTNKPPVMPGQVAIRVCAQVNEMPILDDEVRQTLQPFLAQMQGVPEPERSVRIKEALTHELDKLIDRELLISDAMVRLKKNEQAATKLKEAAAKEFDKQLRGWKENLARQGVKAESDDDLKPILAMQGLSLDFLRRKSEREFMAREYMMNRVWPQVDKIGHKEIRQYYEEHSGQFQAEDRVKWLHIFISNRNPDHPDQVSARRFAEEIVRRLKAGDDFVKLAERYDEGTSKFVHGEGTGQRHGEIRPVDVEPYLFRMREGDIGPIVEMVSGCHIVKLVSREYAGLMPFDENTQLLVRRKLQDIVINRESRRFVDDLRRKATIQYFDYNP